jgi:hypothetical protein
MLPSCLSCARPLLLRAAQSERKAIIPYATYLEFNVLKHGRNKSKWNHHH